MSGKREVQYTLNLLNKDVGESTLTVKDRMLELTYYLHSIGCLE